MSERRGQAPGSPRKTAAKQPADRKPSQAKLAGSAREAALDILTRVEKDRSYSNLLLGNTLERLSLSRADAGLATELVYGTIQRKNTIDYHLARFVKGGLVKLEPWVLSLLRMSFYQLVFLDRIPAHAAVSEAVNIAKRRGHSGISGMVNGVLRSILRQKDQLALAEGLSESERIALTQSHPEWLVNRYVARYGEAAAEAILAANNEAPHASVRVNRLKTSPDQLAREMAVNGLDAHLSELPVPGLVIESGGNMAGTDWFKNGMLSLQDESSMLVAEALAPEPGMRVLDCCAAPGGKTAHLAEAMENTGEVVSCDVHPHKEALIAGQAKRLGLSIVKTVVSDARELSKQYPPESFDCILLDAPCSGLGVIRRKPELKWTKREEEIAELAALQQELLEAVHGLLKPGGVLVYSTCTTEPEENSAQVTAFLNRHPEFHPVSFPEKLIHGFASVQPATVSEPLSENATKQATAGRRRPSAERIAVLTDEARGGTLQLLPSDFGTDGFFIARLGKAPRPMVK
ncbi:16S rRNA (cytosine(967)-C(5))-methyltransferase RsmB [Gorillibacterium timonense]|uniref:16S rRNA (cytosine(967)-C(5))-methyltransferase RsmB n=1 Tax=Gorillibacterium timonense TaxID=1689269 RepID=UPI00071C951F|nr:16S rRNA (cytosine(967)-C(5))-methyltransferase RsmB [Gorillibacterium timonense]